MNKHQKALDEMYSVWNRCCELLVDPKDMAIELKAGKENKDVLQELVDKAIPKKPKEVAVGGFSIARNYFCECGHQIRNNQKHCDECMQAVDWEIEGIYDE